MCPNWYDHKWTALDIGVNIRRCIDALISSHNLPAGKHTDTLAVAAAVSLGLLGEADKAGWPSRDRAGLWQSTLLTAGLFAFPNEPRDTYAAKSGSGV